MRLTTEELVACLKRDGLLLKRLESGNGPMSAMQICECEQHIHDAVGVIEGLRAALTEIASFAHTEKLLWWQIRARKALQETP